MPGEGQGHFEFKEVTAEMTYTRGEGDFKSYLKLKPSRNTMQWVQDFAILKKLGGNTFIAHTQWDAPSQDSRFGFKSVDLMASTKVADNWKLGMRVRPNLTMSNFTQASESSIGLSGNLNDDYSVAAIVTNKQGDHSNANV